MSVTSAKQTTRRLVLGRQGLWPGWRWRGEEDFHAAVIAVEAVQEELPNFVACGRDMGEMAPVVLREHVARRLEQLQAESYRDRNDAGIQ